MRLVSYVQSEHKFAFARAAEKLWVELMQQQVGFFARYQAVTVAAARGLGAAWRAHEDWRLMSVVFAFAAGALVRLTIELDWPETGWLAGGTLLAAALVPAMIPARRIGVWLLLALLAGTTAASYRLDGLPTERIERETFVSLEGRVVRVEHRPERPPRLTLHVTQTDKAAWLDDHLVRLTVRTELAEALRPGHFAAVRAVLDAAGGPIVPGGFDFARYSRFQGIAGQGFAISPVRALPGEGDGGWRASLERRRDTVANRILSVINQPLGGVAVALVTGQRQYIDRQTAAILRDAGLAHLLAISGLHMGLVTGIAFFLFELLFAGIPPLAARILPRKAAAVCAWGIGLAYLLLSGGSVSTQRAFVMVSIAILAVLTDRRVLSLRSVALAALAILVFSPEAILSSGFHMSFAATIGIICVYDRWLDKKAKDRDEGRPFSPASPIRRIGLYFGAAAAVTIISQIAITPFALVHFQAVSITGIVANLIAVPVMAFVVMPAALLALVLGPVGLDLPLLLIMEQGLGIVLWSADLSVGLPAAVYRTAPYSDAALLFAAAGFAAMMFWRSSAGIAVFVAAISLGLILGGQRPADILLDNSGRVMAQPLAGDMAIIGGRRGGFREEAWRRYWGLDPMVSSRRMERLCDTKGCQANIMLNLTDDAGPSVSLVRSRDLGATRRACAAGAIVIASYTHERHCRGALLFVAEEDIERYGPAGLWLEGAAEGDVSASVRWSQPKKEGR